MFCSNKAIKHTHTPHILAIPLLFVYYPPVSYIINFNAKSILSYSRGDKNSNCPKNYLYPLYNIYIYIFFLVLQHILLPPLYVQFSIDFPFHVYKHFTKQTNTHYYYFLTFFILFSIETFENINFNLKVMLEFNIGYNFLCFFFVCVCY